MVRLVFRPYTQLRRSICTSESLRSSIRVSPDFNLARHSSPSFGSQRVCSCCSARCEVDAKRRGCALAGSPLRHRMPFAFTPPLGLVRPMARTHVRLLGPCFKTGRRDRRPTRDRDADRVSEHACYTSRLEYPSAAETGAQGLPANKFTNKLHPGPRSTANGSSRKVPEKCNLRPEQTTEGRPRGSHPPPTPDRKPESPTPTSRVPPFTTTQFHVLLNSLFKVLFNFPSRYLFAIGLGVIFSLTWSLPRTLSCTPKQLDSRGKPAQRNSRLTGLSPSMGCGPSQGGLGLAVTSRGGSPKHHIPRDRGGRRFGAGLCPFHSPLLRASRLFSFPPLINMLKFGGSPCLLSGRKSKNWVRSHLPRKNGGFTPKVYSRSPTQRRPAEGKKEGTQDRSKESAPASSQQSGRREEATIECKVLGPRRSEKPSALNLSQSAFFFSENQEEEGGMQNRP